MMADTTAPPAFQGPTLKDVLERANRLSKQVEGLSKFIQNFPAGAPLMASTNGARGLPAGLGSADLTALESENAELKAKVSKLETNLEILHRTTTEKDAQIAYLEAQLSSLTGAAPMPAPLHSGLHHVETVVEKTPVVVEDEEEGEGDLVAETPAAVVHQEVEVNDEVATDPFEDSVPATTTATIPAPLTKLPDLDIESIPAFTPLTVSGVATAADKGWEELEEETVPAVAAKVGKAAVEEDQEAF